MAVTFIAAIGQAAKIDRGHDALGAETARRLAHKAWVIERRRVDRDLVGARPQQPLDLFEIANAAADRERDEALGGKLLDRFVIRLAPVRGGADVEQDELVDLTRVVDLDRGQDRSDPAPAMEADALHQSQILPQQRRDNPDLKHRQSTGRGNY